MKVEVILDMKAQHGEFIGPRAPFGYQKSNENPSQLVPDPVAAVIVRKIFEMAASGTGVTGIVRYLSEPSLHRFSTPGLTAWTGTLMMAMAVGAAGP